MHLKMSPGRLGALCATAGLAGSLLLAGAAGASARGLTTVRIAYNPNPSNTTIVVAQQQGYFKKNGINAVLTPSQNTAALIPALGKQFDIVNATPPSVLQAAAAGEKLTLFAGEDVETKSLLDTYFIADKGITSLKQLKGDKIGVVGLSGTIYESAVVALNKAGVSKNDVKFLVVPFPDTAGDLANGTIQATVTIVPFNGQLFGEGYSNLGDPVLAVTQSTPGLDIGWGATQAYAKSNPTVLKEFVKAQNEAKAWIIANQTAAQGILEKDFQLPAVAAQHYPVYQYISLGVNKKYLSDWLAPMKAVGDLPKSFKPDYSALITNN